tara:strand:+ start:250 stop:426 length:177 start_codon:yes stop_codon:yes gene_type:complete
MNELLNDISLKTKENKFEENLFVDKIIVNKNKNPKIELPYIATEKWISQLGSRLETNY